MTKTITIKNARSAFVEAMGNGVLAAEVLKFLVDDMIANNMDGRIIAGALNDMTTQQKKDIKGYRATKAILGLVFTGLKFKLDDEEQIAIGTKNAVFNQDAYDRFADAVEANDSIRGYDLLNKVKGKQAKPKAKFDVKKSATLIVKRAEKEGVSKAALIAAIQAA